MRVPDLSSFIGSKAKMHRPIVIQHPHLEGPVQAAFIVAVLHHKDGGQLPKRNTPGLIGFMPVFSSKEDASAYFGDDTAVHELYPHMVKTPNKWK